MRHLVLATNNANKVSEITELLGMNGLTGLTIESIGSYTQHEPVEDGGSYLANATIKAQAAAAITGLPCLAEDSGVEIAALGGAPGVETAPWVAAQGGWIAAMLAVHEKVKETGRAGMDFQSTFVLAFPDGTFIDATACCPGTFTYPPRGHEGFGHDPYFVPAEIKVEEFNYFIPYGGHCTYAEMGLAEKQKISPRALAMGKLVEKIKKHDRAAEQQDHQRTQGHA